MRVSRIFTVFAVLALLVGVAGLFVAAGLQARAARSGWAVIEEPQEPARDWDTSLAMVRTESADERPASIAVMVALGYREGDDDARRELSDKHVEIMDFLREYFSRQTVESLRPQNEAVIRLEIRDLLNNRVLTSSAIREVRFTHKEVVAP